MLFLPLAISIAGTAVSFNDGDLSLGARLLMFGMAAASIVLMFLPQVHFLVPFSL